MTKPKKTSAPADGPMPDRGGAFIRQEDGTLIRDPDVDQHIPADEAKGDPIEPTTIASPPPANEADQSQEA